MNQTLKGWLKGIAIVALAALPVLLWTQRQNIYDTYRIHTYEPNAQIAQLATDTTMTDEGKRLFYVAHPQLDGQDVFNQNCNISEFSIILGCYISKGNIYLYDVTDTRLAGIQQVTAAHEMLHVAYERLSSSERAHLDKLLTDTFNSLNDERLNETIAQYRAVDPSSVPNELHSILGSEVQNLPPELEAYYARYFSNRLAVVGYSEQYEHEFAARKAQVATYDVQLESLKKQIESNQSSLLERRSALEAKQTELERLKANEQYGEYNAQVDDFNAQVNAYNALVANTKRQIEQYNSMVAARNALAVEVQQLVQAIDSTPQTIQQ